MQPRAIHSDRSSIQRAHRQVERLAALSAQPGALNRGVKQEPERHAVAEGRRVFLPRIPIRLVECTSVKNGPVVSSPFGRASPISGTARISVFRAARAPLRVAAFPRKETAVMVAGDLLSHRGWARLAPRWSTHAAW